MEKTSIIYHKEISTLFASNVVIKQGTTLVTKLTVSSTWVTRWRGGKVDF